MQNVSNLVIPEGAVRTIHDKNNRLIWGAVGYDTKYAGDTYQQTYSGTNLFNDKTLYSKTISGDVTIIDDNGFTLYDDGTGGGWKNAAFEVSGFTANTNYSMKFNQTNTNPAMTKSWIAIGPGGILNQTYTSGTQVHFNSGENTTLRFLFYAQVGAGSVAENTATVTNVQINVGSSTGAYEPYTAGPAPNPDYPEPINVVTGEQNVWVHGKNLFDESGAIMTVGLLRASGTIDYTQTNRLFTNGFIKVSPNTTYTFQFQSGVTGKTVQAYALAYKSDKATVTGGLPTAAWYDSGFSFTTGANDEYVRFSYHFTDNDTMTTSSVVNQQLEKGTATTYEPYQGATYTIDLGSTKLYKIGTYKDYIYPNNGNWYIHRENGAYTADGTENVSIASTTPAMIYIPNSEALEGQNNTLMSTHFRYEWANKIGACYVSGSGHKMACGVSGVDTVSAAQSWLSSNHPEFVYILASPTDTQITDSTLISQLDAVNEWLTRYDYNATVTGNLPLIVDKTNL